MKNVIVFSTLIVLSVSVGVCVPKMFHKGSYDQSWEGVVRNNVDNLKSNGELNINIDKNIDENKNIQKKNHLKDGKLNDESDKNRDIGDMGNEGSGNNDETKKTANKDSKKKGEKNSNTNKKRAGTYTKENNDEERYTSKKSVNSSKTNTKKYSSKWIDNKIKEHEDEIAYVDMVDFRRILACLNQSYIGSLAEGGFDSNEQDLLKKHLVSNLTEADYYRSRQLFSNYDYLLDEE